MTAIPPRRTYKAVAIGGLIAALTVLAACTAEEPDSPADRVCDSGIEIKTCDADSPAYSAGDSIELSIALQNTSTEGITESLLLELRAQDGSIVDAGAVEFSVPPGTMNTYKAGGFAASSGVYALVVSAAGCRCESRTFTAK